MWTPDVRPDTTEFAVIGQAIGAASMCWDPKPTTQIFDSTQAAQIATGLESYLLRNQKAYSVAQKLYELTSHTTYPFEQLRTDGPLKGEHNQSYETWLRRAQELLVWLHR
jgi:hypothetical protein